MAGQADFLVVERVVGLEAGAVVWVGPALVRLANPAFAAEHRISLAAAVAIVEQLPRNFAWCESSWGRCEDRDAAVLFNGSPLRPEDLGRSGRTSDSLGIYACLQISAFVKSQLRRSKIQKPRAQPWVSMVSYSSP